FKPNHICITMEVDASTTSGTAAASASDSLSAGSPGHMAPQGVQPSVNAALHPLVLLTISDHWTRCRLQFGHNRVLGALLGKQEGRLVEICNCFELAPYFSPANPQTADIDTIDAGFFQTRLAQYREVYPSLTVVGWYYCCDLPEEVTDTEAALHKQVCDLVMSDSPLMPVLLRLLPSSAATTAESLPVRLFESVLELVNGSPKCLFIPLPYSLATEEAERIGVDHVSRDMSGSGGTKVAEALAVQRSAVRALYSRLGLLLSYLRDVSAGRLPPCHSILRDLRRLADQLPVCGGEDFYRSFYRQCNDVQLTALLGTLIQATNTVHQLIGRTALLQDRRRRGVPSGYN
ncbi:hypothetical protein BOX15_Mlig006623g3, partial [Macrostomum lignano]